LPIANNLSNISYNSIKNLGAFCIDKKIGDLSKHDAGRALYQMIVMFTNADMAYQTVLGRIGTEYRKGDHIKKKEMFTLINNDQQLLNLIVKALKQKEAEDQHDQNNHHPQT